MSIADRSPAPNAQIETGDLFSCEITHTGASAVTVTVDGELAWSLAAGGQAGFTVSKATLSGVTTISVTRDAGWAGSPVVVEVEITGGAEAGTTSWTYYVGTQTAYPPGTQPYHDTLETGISALEDGVQTVTDLSKIDIDSASMTLVKTAEGRAKLFAVPNAAGWRAGGFGQWTLDPLTGTGPADGFFRFNDTQAAATAIYFGNADLSGNDPETALSALGVGQYLKLQNGSNIDGGSLWEITGAPSDQGTYWSMNVTRVQAGTADLDVVSPVIFVDVGQPAAASTFASGIGRYTYVTGGTPATGELSAQAGATSPDTWTSLEIHEERVEGAAANLFGLHTDVVRDGDWIIVEKSDDPVGNFAYYKVNADATAAASVATIGVTYKAHIGTFSATDVLAVKHIKSPTAGAGGTGAGMDQKEYVSGGGAPASAKMTANADALSSVTTLNLSDSSGVDNNFSIAYGAIKAGDFFVIRDNAGGGAHGTFEVVSSVDNTTYWTFTVTFKNVAGSFVATNDYDIFVLSAGQGDTEATVDLVGDTSTQQEANQLLDGCSLDTPSLTCTSNGTLWSATLEKSGTGDIRYRFNGQTYTLDCTPAAVVILTAGTATVPVINYVYVVESGGTLTLTANTTGFPTTAARVATVYCQDAAAGATDGALKLHQWNDHVASDLGHVSHINEKLRRGNADWVSGCAPTMVIADPNASFNVATGTVYQVHEQTFPAITGATSGMWVVNYHNGTIPVPFTKITSLDTVDWDSAGVSINNRYFPLVVWGTQNANGTGKIFINLPSGSYAGSAAAQADADNYANYNIPPEFKGTGFLIARYNVQGKTSGLWVEVDSVDLRGLTPAGSPSASSGGSGDVVGPGASVLSNAIASYDGTGGLTIKQANILVGAGSVGTGTRTLGANSALSGGFLASAGSSIVSSGNGSIALGYATGTASVNATGIGSISIGYCSQSTSGTLATITNSGLGSLVIGATAQTVSGTASLNCSTAGAFVGGYASQGGLVEAVSASNGCCATGYADGTGSIIRVTGALGGFASGSAQAGGTIITSGKGAFASGAADIQSGGTAGTIAASGLGSFAGGSALGAVAGGTAQITASGSGSFAWGSVLAVGVTSAIAATATNAVQFGIGTNAVADSLQVGDTTNGLRLLAKGTTSTTVGSFWTDGTDVFCRTGGVTKNLTNI